MINRSVGRVDMQGFQTKALVVTLIGGDNFRLIPPNCIVGWHVCSDKAEFSSFKRRPVFNALSNVYKLMFGLSNILAITVMTEDSLRNL